MSVAGKSTGTVSATVKVDAVQPVALYDAATGLPASAGGGGATGPGTAAAAQRVTFASDAPSIQTKPAQGTVVTTAPTLVANTAQTILAASATTLGIRVLNWTASPVYVTVGSLGATPPSGAGSDFIPAAASGVPGQWEPPFAPVLGVRAVGASAGGLTVEAW